jgi:hypothetical protein
MTISRPHSIAITGGRLRNAVAGCAIAASLLVAGACEDESAHPPLDDIDAGWTCTHEAGLVRTAGTITNHSSKTSFYLIDIEFRDNGKVVANRGASVDGVGPGQTTQVESVAAVTDATDISCHVKSVDRFKA